MAMTESPAHQQQYIHEPLAGPSSSPAVDEARKGSCQKLEASAASSTTSTVGNNGPTPPSSPPQGIPVESLVFALSDMQDAAENSNTPAVTATPVHQQQPTPPGTLPEDVAAFPQAATEHLMEDDDIPTVTSPTNTRESYIAETRLLSITSDDTPPNPLSLSSPSSASSVLNDGIPTLDADDAAFLIEADQMDDNERSSLQDASSFQTRNNHERSPHQEVENTNVEVPFVEVSEPRTNRAPSSHSSHSNLPQLPQQQAPYQSANVMQPAIVDPLQHPYRYSSLIAAEGHTRPQDTRRRSVNQTTNSTRPDRRRQFSDITVPPWQPDSEVNNCPICANAFSFFYRKHHCRKCGRVVCAPCSPHRIVIPKSYVVYPPNTLDTENTSQGSADPSSNRQHSFLSDDAGVEVRICEDCLAGQNPSSRTQYQRMSDGRDVLIQSPAGGAGRFWQDTDPSDGSDMNSNSYSGRRRARSNVSPFTAVNSPGHHLGGGGVYPGTAYNNYNQSHGQSHSLGRTQPHSFLTAQHPPYHTHPHQQVYVQTAPAFPQPHHHQHHHSNYPSAPAHFYPSPQPPHYQHHGHHRSASSTHPYSQFAAVNHPIRGHLDTSQQPIPSFSMPDARPHLPIASEFMRGGSPSQPPAEPPRPRLKETDYCPICTAVLPPVNPTTGDESDREAHVLQCIINAESAASSRDVGRRQSATGSPVGGLSPPTLTPTPPTHPHTAPPQSSPHAERTRRNTASARNTAGRMVVYTAAEIDTYALGNDAVAEGRKAECVICFEEFEVGDSIARLECFCRYHKACIREWFDRKGNGECPVHAVHD